MELKKISPKSAAIEAIFAERSSPAGAAMLEFAIQSIDGFRKDNDHAQGDEVLRNQGRIDAFKTMLGALTVGLPIQNK